MTDPGFRRSSSPKVARISSYHISPREFSEIQAAVADDFQSEFLIGRWDIGIRLHAVQPTELSDDFMTCVVHYRDKGYEYLLLDPLGPTDSTLKTFDMEGD